MLSGTRQPRANGTRAALLGLLLVALAVVVVAQEEEEAPPTDLRLPPRVIAVSPEEGAMDVNPGLTEISVTFDRPMEDNMWSWMRLDACGNYPGNRQGQPSFNAERTVCTLPVDLRGGMVYAVGINSPTHTGFRDDDGTPAVNFGWAFVTGEVTVGEMPPRVVDCWPENGAVDVDFRAQEISVTFDQEMVSDSWSWVYQSESGVYPGFRGGDPPQFDGTNKTCSLQVRLSPGTVYALSINSYRHTGFKNLSGKAAVPFGWTFRTAD